MRLTYNGLKAVCNRISTRKLDEKYILDNVPLEHQEWLDLNNKKEVPDLKIIKLFNLLDIQHKDNYVTPESEAYVLESKRTVATHRINWSEYKSKLSHEIFKLNSYINAEKAKQYTGDEEDFDLLISDTKRLSDILSKAKPTRYGHIFVSFNDYQLIERYIPKIPIKWREYEHKLSDALFELNSFIEKEKNKPQSDYGVILGYAIEDSRKLAYIISQSESCRSKTLYLRTYDYKLIESYTTARDGLKQRLTPAGVKYIYQAITQKKYGYRFLMSESSTSPIVFGSIINQHEVDLYSVERVFKALGIKLQPEFLVYPYVSMISLPPSNPDKYANKSQRNAEIVSMYESGNGLRVLAQTFNLSQSGIRKILTKEGVYQGDEEGQIRHKLGGWGKQKPTKARTEAMTKSKRTTSKQIRKNLFDKRIGA